MHHFYDQGRPTVNTIFSLSWPLQGASKEGDACAGRVTDPSYECPLALLEFTTLGPGGGGA